MVEPLATPQDGGALVDVMTIEIALETDWDEEHTLGAQIQGWALADLCGSIAAHYV